MNNNKSLVATLSKLGLSKDEGRIYIELLKQKRTHLELARLTGINRTKVYRIADDLQKKSLISVQTDDTGSFLLAHDPQSLEVDLTTKEQTIVNQLSMLEDILPDLKQLRDQSDEKHFKVNTYEGVEGMKQMLWHELKTKGEILIFGSGAMEQLGVSKRWAEKHRSRTIDADYKIREILNHGTKKNDFTSLEGFSKVFEKRIIPAEILQLEHQIVIYNNTVGTYHWRNDQKVGYEVVSPAYAAMWRQMFENYWKLAK